MVPCSSPESGRRGEEEDDSFRQDDRKAERSILWAAGQNLHNGVSRGTGALHVNMAQHSPPQTLTAY